MEKLFEESKRIKAQADQILQSSGIVELLESYGEVKIAGSYTLDVMLRPDLDLFVVTDQHDWEEVLKIHSQIMRSKYFRELDFVNWIDFEVPPVASLRGYYFQPMVPIEDQLWKLDVWLITEEYDKTAETTEHFKQLLDEADASKRIEILKIKEAMRQGRKYVQDVDGRLIYQAVLEHGISSPEDFKEFVHSRKLN